jgi:hypothetical protein
MKKILILLFGLCCFLKVNAQTASGQCGNKAYWALEDSVFTISGGGPTWDYGYFAGGTVYSTTESSYDEYRAQIKSVVVESGITNLGACAFTNFSNLVSVQLPETLEGLGDVCFYACSSLSSIRFLSLTPPGCSQNTFFSVRLDAITLAVPYGCSDIYRADPDWGQSKEILSDSYVPLRSLAVNSGTLSPSFSPDIFEYAVDDVSGSLSSIVIKAIANDPTASVTGAGPRILADGYNFFPVTVTAANGNKQDYSISVYRLSNDATLRSLSVAVDAYSVYLSPVFNSAQFNYSVAVPNSTERIAIYAVTNHSEATVTGTGFKNLNSDSTFNIAVTSEDGTVERIYTVNITRDGLSNFQEIRQQPVRVYFDNPCLRMDSPAAERIHVYSVTGTLLYSFDKPAGAFTSPFTVHPSPILIVKGSSGWSKKINH